MSFLLHHSVGLRRLHLQAHGIDDTCIAAPSNFRFAALVIEPPRQARDSCDAVLLAHLILGLTWRLARAFCNDAHLAYDLAVENTRVLLFEEEGA